MYLFTQREAVMPKTKKKPMPKAVAAALKAMGNMTFENADLGAQLEQLRETLSPAGVINLGSIYCAGRLSSGDAFVEVSVGSPPIGYFSIWPEWAYEIAKDALLFNKQVVLMYSDAPIGPNLQMAICSNRPV
jgi:hypothetical protein